MSDNHYNFISIVGDILHKVYGLIMKLLQLFWEHLHETSFVKADMTSSMLLYRDKNGNFDVFLTVHLSIILVIYQLNSQILVL